MKVVNIFRGVKQTLASIWYVFSKAKGALTFRSVCTIALIQILYLLRYIFLALLPSVNADIVESAVNIAGGSQAAYAKLAVAILILLLYALYHFLSGSILTILAKKTEKSLWQKINGSFLTKISSVKYGYFNNPEMYENIILVKDKIRGMVNDVFMSGMFASIVGLFTVIVYTFIGLAEVDWFIGLLLLFGNSITIFSTYLQTRKDFYAEVDQLSEKRWADVYSGLLTSADTEKEVRVNATFDYIHEKWATATKARKKKNIKILFGYSAMDMVIAAVKYVFLGISLVLVISMIVEGRASVDKLVLVYTSHTVLDGKLSEFFGSILKLRSLSYSVGKWREIDALADEENGGCDIPDACNGAEDGWEIQVEHVSYRYENTDANAVDDVSFSIRAGEKVAIVGENGSGKTTLVHLILGLLSPDAGSIRINKRDSRDVMDVFRNGISVMFQDFCHYEVSLRDNIQLGDIDHEKSDREIREIIEKSGVAEIADKLKDGVDTRIGQLWDNGTDFSGGQWQKIALSRLYSRPSARLLVMDEPTSALDPVAETDLYRTIMTDFREKGMVIVSHRLGFMSYVDKIIVMQEGKIVDVGNHAELMQNCELYKNMYTSFLELYMG